LIVALAGKDEAHISHCWALLNSSGVFLYNFRKKLHADHENRYCKSKDRSDGKLI